MSVADSVSEAIGSPGTTTGSLTGSGGPGVRDPVVEPEDAGGVVGRATGGFFFPHAPTISNVTIATTTTVRLCIIVSYPSSVSLGRYPLSLPRDGGYCDQ